MAKINYKSKAPQPLEPVKQGESSFYNVPDSTASNQNQELELTVAQIMNSLLPNSD